MKQNFSNFYIGKSNKAAFDVIKNIADKGKINYLTVLLCGKNGTGKTHLMVSLEQTLKDKLKIIRISSNEFIQSIKNNKKDKIYNNLDVIIIEDIQFFISTLKLENQIYSAIKKLTIDKNIPIIMTVDREKQELNNLEFISKLMQINYERNLVLEIKETLENKTKRLIIKDFQNINNIIIAEPKIKILLKECSNYQELQNKLNATKILSK